MPSGRKFFDVASRVCQRLLRFIRCMGFVVPVLTVAHSAIASVVLEGDRALDTETGLVFLNVREADAFVVRLGEVTGGWSHATDGAAEALFVHAQGGVDPTPFNPFVADLILALGGAAMNTGTGVAYGIQGWYQHTPSGHVGSYDELFVSYRQLPGGLWSVYPFLSSIGDYTALPPQFTRPQPFFIVTSVPEPAPVRLIAAAALAIGLSGILRIRGTLGARAA